MKRIPSDVMRGDTAATEKFLGEVHTPTSHSPPDAGTPITETGTTAAAASASPEQSATSATEESANKSLVTKVLSTAGSFLYSFLASGSNNQNQQQQQQQPPKFQDPTAGVATTTKTTSPASAAAASSSSSASASTPSTLSTAAAVGNSVTAATFIPATSILGTFVSCSRFSAHLVDNDPSQPFHPAQPAIFMKRVMNELKHLRSTCSQVADIFVKSNEDRIHTLKFAIAGGVHTPYYGGFFCFDLALPPTFPNAPPVVRFHSRNMRLNPNLYEDGLVCLSLLGTWNGQTPGESWSVSSTLRQVMLSIQALILCQEPFYNEPGDEALNGTRDGAAHSKMYNEKVFLLKIGHLMHQAVQHPADWFGEFREHYLRAVPRMLARWRRYLELAAGGTAASSSGAPPPGSVNADGLILPMSAGMRHALARRIEQLEQQHATLSAKWKEEMTDFAFGGNDEDDDE